MQGLALLPVACKVVAVRLFCSSNLKFPPMNRSFVAQFGITLSKSFFSTVLTRLIIDAWLCSRISTTMPRKQYIELKR
jgi:hypothetical protein